MLVRFDRFPVRTNGDVLGFEKGIDSLFDSVLRPGLMPWFGRMPAVDVSEYPAETVFLAELPGVKKDDVKISFENGVLMISGERKQSTVADGGSSVRNELRYGSFSRSFEIGHDVNADGISAELADGVLRVVVPKAEKAKAREISVNVK
jgi:HSP20 family protein